MRVGAGWRLAAGLAALGGLLLTAAAPAWATAGNVATVAGSASGGNSGARGYAGDGTPATGSQVAMWYPQGVAVDAAGDIFIAEPINNVVRAVAAHSGTLLGIPVVAGDIYTVAGNGYSSDPGQGVPGAGGYSGDGGPATAAKLNQPQSVATDAAGNLYIADTNNNRIREVAATNHEQYGIAMRAGDIYTLAGNGTQGFSDGHGLASKAELSFPEGVAVDRAGNVFIADSLNNRIREIPATPGLFGGHFPFSHFAFNHLSFNLFGFHLRLPMDGRMPAHIVTVAGNGTAGFSGDGGWARAAELRRPMNVAADARGDIFFTDQDTFTGLHGGRIREIARSDQLSFGQRMRRGHIYTLAGGGTQAPTTAGVPAAAASLNAPWGIAVDSAGDVIFTEYQAYTVDVLAAQTRSAFGAALTAGDVSVAAGISGQLGCGEGPGTAARFDYPAGIALDGAGNVDIADSFCERVAQLSGS